MTKSVTNIAASKHARILSLAKSQNLIPEPLFLLYMEERLLYRIAQSPLADKLILKGGLLLFTLFRQTARPTRDIDALAVDLPDKPDELAELFKPVCRIDAADGVAFDAESIKTEVIREAGNYQGVRLSVYGYLGKGRTKVQIDIGFHDVVSPGPTQMTYPVLLDDPAPVLTAYSLESVVAEKFEAMISLGEINSRMKDFYDVAMLASHNDFDGLILSTAVRETLLRRKTTCPPSPSVFADAFATDPTRVKRWMGFLGTTNVSASDLAETLSLIRAFLGPIYTAHLSQWLHAAQWNHKHRAWQ